jgi:hypothetical protein
VVAVEMITLEPQQPEVLVVVVMGVITIHWLGKTELLIRAVAVVVEAGLEAPEPDQAAQAPSSSKSPIPSLLHSLVV